MISSATQLPDYEKTKLDLDAQRNMRVARRRATPSVQVEAWTLLAILLSQLSPYSAVVVESSTITKDEPTNFLPTEGQDLPVEPQEQAQCDQTPGPGETSVQSVIGDANIGCDQHASSTTLLTNAFATNATNSSSGNSSSIVDTMPKSSRNIAVAHGEVKHHKTKQLRHKRGSTHEDSILEDIKTLFSSNMNDLDSSFYDDFSNASSFGNSSEVISLGDEADDGPMSINSVLDKRSSGADNEAQEILSETLMGALTEELEKQDSKETQSVAVLKKTLRNNLSPGKYFPALVVMVPYSPSNANQSMPQQQDAVPSDIAAVAIEQPALVTTLGAMPSGTLKDPPVPAKNASKQAIPILAPVGLQLPDPNQNILAQEAIAGRNKDGTIHRRGVHNPPEIDLMTNNRQHRSKESQGKPAAVDWFAPTGAYDGWAVEANHRDRHVVDHHCRCGRCKDLMKALEEKQRAEIALLMKKFQRYTEKLLASQSRERRFVVGNLVGECTEDDVEGARVANLHSPPIPASMQKSNPLPSAADLLSSLVSSSILRETNKQPPVVSLTLGQKPPPLNKPPAPIHGPVPHQMTSKTVTMMYVLASDVRTSSERGFPARVPSLPKVSDGEEPNNRQGLPGNLQEQSMQHYRQDPVRKTAEAVAAESHPVARMNIQPSTVMEVPAEGGGGSHQQDAPPYVGSPQVQQQLQNKQHQQQVLVPVPMQIPMAQEDRMNPAEAFHGNLPQQSQTESPAEQAEQAEPAKKKKKRRKTNPGSKTKRKDGKRAKRQIVHKKKEPGDKKKGSKSKKKPKKASTGTTTTPVVTTTVVTKKPKHEGRKKKSGKKSRKT